MIGTVSGTVRQIMAAGQSAAVAEDMAVIEAKAAEYAAEIRRRAGDLTDFPVWFNEVLVGIYEREKVGSLYMPDKTKERDQFMCKGGVILALGPGVDVDDNTVQFYGRKLKVGDWIAFMPADGWPIRIRDQQCRIIPDQRIKMSIPSPDLIY